MPRAPRRCPGDQGNCTNLITNTRYCPEHTIAWSGDRTISSEITSSRRWKQHVRPRVLTPGRQCHLQFPGICTGLATVVDKRDPAARNPGAAWDPDNHQPACDACNAHKARTADRQRPA